MRFTLKDSNRLLAAINQAQGYYLRAGDSADMYRHVLGSFIELSGSEFGFIGQVHCHEGGPPFFKTHAFTNIAWDDETRTRFTQQLTDALEFDIPDSLSGAVLASGKRLISNNPALDSFSRGPPPGFPALRCFMGLPVHAGDVLVGMVAVANRKGGYTDDLAEFLQPLVNTCGQLIYAADTHRNLRRVQDELESHHGRLEASETSYRLFFELSPEAILIVHGDRYTDCNEAAVRLFCYPDKKAILNSRPGDLSPPVQWNGENSRGMILRHIQECQLQGKASFDWVSRRASGELFDGEVHMALLDPADRDVIQVVIRDISHRKRLEQQLRDQEHYLDAIVDGSPIAIVVTKRETGNVVLANKQAMKLKGMQSFAAGQSSVRQFWVNPHDRERLIGMLRETGQASGEVKLKIDDDQQISAHITCQPNPGAPDEIMWWVSDITEQVNAHEELKNQELLLQQILDHVPIALWVKDIADDFRYIFNNRKSEELSPPFDKEVVGNKDADLFPPMLAQEIRDVDLEILRTGQNSVAPEQQIEFPNGERLVLRTTKVLIPDVHGVPRLILGMGEDLTERIEAEKALRVSEKRFKALAENAPVGIFLTDARGKVIYVNRAYQEISGLSNETAAGEGWHRAMHPDDLTRATAEFQAFVEGRQEYKQEWRIVCPGGLAKWVSTTAVPFRNEDDLVVGFLGSVIDITASKQYERNLQASKNEAELANAAKSEFLSRMSHELRTPLNAVLGFGQLLQMNNHNLTASQNEGVAHILAGGEHLLSLIEDVLDFSRIASGHMSLKLQRIHLPALLELSVSMVTSMAETRNITIFLPGGPIPDVLADVGRLQQVLINLLSNAIKYNRPGGTVEVSVTGKAGSMVRISVKDSGVGIRESDRPRVFELFERLANTAVETVGTGIGLSICKQLTELMGGQIGFDSTFGTGSTFWVELPAAD